MNKQSAAARWLVFSKRSTFVDRSGLPREYICSRKAASIAPTTGGGSDIAIFEVSALVECIREVVCKVDRERMALNFCDTL